MVYIPDLNPDVERRESSNLSPSNKGLVLPISYKTHVENIRINCMKCQ